MHPDHDDDAQVKSGNGEVHGTISGRRRPAARLECQRGWRSAMNSCLKPLGLVVVEERGRANWLYRTLS